MNYPHLAQRLYNSPLLLTPGKAEIIAQAFRDHIEGRAALVERAPSAEQRIELAAPGMQRTDAGYWRTVDGVALIPVLGTLVQRAGGLDAMSGLTGYNRVANLLQAALDDPRTGAILLEIDSNGGEVAGLADLSSRIASANKRKPTWAVANEAAFSAAYWLASSAGRVSAPASAMVGSIGVVMLHVDQSVKDAKAGVTYTPIFAGERKVDFSSHAPLTEAAREIAQTEVDRVYDSFVAHVASSRSMSEDAVRGTKAGLLHAKAAESIGLVDAVESFDETLAGLVAEMHRFRLFGPSRAATSARVNQGDSMDTTSKQTGAVQPSAEQLTEAQTRGFNEGKAAGTSAGATDERTRIEKILGSPEAAGRRKLAEHLAFKTAHSAEDAAALLAASAKEAEQAANPLAAAMAREGNPHVGADTGTDAAEAKPRINTEGIYKKRQLAVVK
jgi:signal peptide peptidase SppA